MTPSDIFYTLLTPTQIVEYTCTAIFSLQGTDEPLDLANTNDIKVIENFIIDTLIANEITNGFRDSETGKLI